MDLATPHLVSFDIDGTLEVGIPAGAIPIDILRQAKATGWFVGSCSDWPISAQKRLWEEHEIAVDFAVSKSQLDLVRLKFDASSYLHIGDTDTDRWYAERSGFDFLHVNDARLDDWLAKLGAPTS